MVASIPRRPGSAGAELAAAVAARRRAAGLSLAALAERSGLSAGFLSQIETGTANPTLATIDRLTGALGVSLNELLDMATVHRPGSRDFRPRVRRPPTGPADPGSGRIWELTAPGAAGSRVCLVHGEPGDHARTIEHDGEEILVVLSGRMSLQVDEAVDVLDAHDVAHYPATRPHRLSALTPKTRCLIVLIGS